MSEVSHFSHTYSPKSLFFPSYDKRTNTQKDEILSQLTHIKKNQHIKKTKLSSYYKPTPTFKNQSI